jgi:AcrR family transcriptional regulator
MAPRKDARERLQDAALELICRDGYDGVTTRAIAKRAGVNEVTLFRLFGTKEKLLFAALEREADIEQRLPPGGFPSTGDVVADLSQIGRYMLAGMVEKAPIIRLGMTEMHRRPRMWRRIAPAPRTAIELLTGYFDDAARAGLIRKVDSRMAAIIFFSFFFRSFVMTAFLGKDMFITMDGKAIRDFCSMFVEGLGKR